MTYKSTDNSFLNRASMNALIKKRQLQKQIAEIDEFIYLGGRFSDSPAPVPVERRNIVDVVDQILIVYGPKTSDDLLRLIKARGKWSYALTKDRSNRPSTR